MANANKSISIRLPLILFMVFAVAFVLWLFAGEASTPTKPALEVSSEPGQASQQGSRSTGYASSAAGMTAPESAAPAFKNISLQASNYSGYTEPDAALEPIVISEVTADIRDSMADFVDPDDSHFQYEITNPGAVGDFVDPDDETYQIEISNPGSLGDFIDPDDETYQYEISNPGSVGELVDPDGGF